ncbi:energy-coupling factor transporter transmembrane component T [Clostridium aestuarii]|uniref:Energy-coupling factor transporter transmembrane component T n=1 Tax=Clostridium aestuarii TaxID=338193 RepID=A0ABT4CXT4_9CLOT|nr:energy-coupling factor transporter transmembrane component T [Clostridium aestuarii]MCY6483812.1 energy-coupling factor transporter transmembrane component T [Clostridium aestuarii]
MYEKKNNINRLNGLTGLILTAFACIVTIFSQNIVTHVLFVLWLFILLIYFGLVRQSIIYLTVYLLTIFWLTRLVPLGIKFPSPMLFGMIYKFIVPIMAAYLTSKIPSGKVIAVFQKLPIPKNIILILIVMIRFAPTVTGELKAIKEAMKVRGFIGDFRKIMFHPLKTLEYAVVPIIFRAIKVGDELAAASIVRGVDNPCRKESYYSNRLGYVDYMILAISLLMGIMAIGY